MKKLMVALAAVATAFGLYAADAGFVSGTNFNGIATGEFDGSAEEGLWTMPQAGNESEIVTAAWESRGDWFLPTQFAKDVAGNCLKVKTSLGAPISRSSEIEEQGDYAYVDFNTQFTVFDFGDNPTVGSDAKFALWLQLSEDEKATNVFLKAGCVDGDPKVYDCGSVSEYNFADWNRVTIKAIANIGGKTAGFVAFLNGEVLKVAEDYDIGMEKADVAAKSQKWFDACALFPSLGVSGVTGIGFDGQGWIDNLAFTTTAPEFAKDDEIFTATWPKDGSVVAVKVNGKDVSPAELAAGSAVCVLPAGGAVTIAWTGADGFIDGSKTFTDVTDGGETQLKATDVLPAVAKFDAIKFAALADAVDYANTNGTAGTITLLKSEDAAAQDGYSLNAEGTVLDATGFVMKSAVSAYAAVSIAGGTFDGKVEAARGGAITINGGKFLATANEDESGNCTLPAQAGKYWKKGDDGYYTSEAFQVATAPTVNTGLTYSGEEQTGVNSDGVGCTITGTTAATDAGDYQATATLEPGYVWNDDSTDAKKIDWSIAQAKATVVTAPTASGEIEKDAQLSTIDLVNGVGDPAAGTFVWVNPDQTVSADGNFKAVFKPTDSKNYTDSDEFDVAVTVKSGSVPPVIVNEEQKAAYNEWLKGATFAAGETDAIYADYFAIGLTDAEVEAAGSVEKAASDKLAAMITPEMVAAIAAGGLKEGKLDETTFKNLEGDYVNAQFTFEVANEIPAEKDVSGFYRLTATFKPAN